VCKYGLLYLVASAIAVLRVQLRFVDCINKRKKKGRPRELRAPRLNQGPSEPCNATVRTMRQLMVLLIRSLIDRPTEKNERKYLVFDGDVDALWVENMNSVMDDNRLLTLANGERIRLQRHCALLFEVYFSTSFSCYHTA